MKTKKPVAITAGVFDCLHEGHVNLLRRMRKEAEEVVVFLHDDQSTFLNKGRYTVQTLEHRKRNLLASGLVNAVVNVYDQNPAETIELFACGYNEPTDIVFVRGDDWRDFPGKARLQELGIVIKLIQYTKGVSTTKIRKSLQ